LRKRHQKVFAAFLRTKVRLREKDHTFPTFFLIGVGIVLIISCLTNLNLDPRLGHPTEPIVFEGKTKERTGIWLAVYLNGSKMTVSSGGREVFSWEADHTQGKEFEAFRSFLKMRAKTILSYDVLAGNLADRNSEVVLSLDQNLTYYHMRPILQALADAKISRYSFETKLVKLSDASQEVKEHR